MGAATAGHPSDQTLHAYSLGKLDDASAESVSKHLGSCPGCQRRVAELSSDSFLGRLRGAQGSPEMSATDKSQVGGSSTERWPAVAILPPPAATLPPGLAEHPDYAILRELGRGGMGVVYLARNKLMGRLEVLKVVGGHLVERPGVRDRFLREVQAAAKLQHKNIVAAYAAMRFGESIALAMEYIEGDDLAKVVKSDGPLVVINACYFVYQAALGLQHAHERGMVHRDIKPANLILARDGKKAVVKVLDFGLAKVTSEGQADSGLTREGQMLGTPDYIAPEQIRNAQSADIRADVYSLGCTFYYLLAGRPPFQGEHLWDVYQAHFSMDAGPLNLVRPEVPVELAALVAKMMAKEPARRFQTPGDVAQALVPFFKKGSERVGVSSAELSQARQPVERRESAGVGYLSTHPASNPAPAPPAALKQPAAPQQDSNWESLIELDETGSTLDRAAAFVESVFTPRWVWPSAAAGVVVCVLIAAWASGRFTPKTNDSASVDRAIHGEPAHARDLRGPEDPSATEPPNPRELAKLADQSTDTPFHKNPAEPDRANPPASDPDRRAMLATGRAERAPAPATIGSREHAKGDGVDKKGAVDIRQVISLPGIKRLADPDAVRHTEGFWPSLSPGNLDNWQIGDPDHITMNEKGVFLEAGPKGNLLLTADMSYRKCTLKLTLSAKPGTEAFLALRARRGAGGWQAVTARLIDEGGKIHVGQQATDFQTVETGSAREDIAPNKAFVMSFHIDEKNLAGVTVKGEKTSTVTLERPPANEDAGAVGMFVKSGTLIIERLYVH